MNPEGGNKMNINAKIIEIRKQRDMTQEDFAKIFHVTMLMCHKVTQKATDSRHNSVKIDT